MSILSDVKSVVSVVGDDTVFNIELLLLINSTVSILIQLGVEEFEGIVVDETTTWPTFVDKVKESLVRSYLPLHVRLYFDPQPSATITEAHKHLLSQYEGRIVLLEPET